MKVTVKVRFNASSERFEKFGNNMYIAYLPFEQENDAADILREVLSRRLGVPIGRVSFIGTNSITKDWIFDLQ